MIPNVNQPLFDADKIYVKRNETTLKRQGDRMKLAHTMIRVKNLEASLEFYIEFLGLREVRRKTIGSEATLVFLTDETESHHLELTYNHGKADYTLGDQFGHIAFHVKNLDRVIEKVQARGFIFRRSRPELSSKYIFIKDPNGYDIEILESS